MTDQPGIASAGPGVAGAPTQDEPLDKPLGPARDFAAFCELERERRRNSDDGFDPDRFDAAVTLVLGKLAGQKA
jgi:hypothetical protein